MVPAADVWNASHGYVMAGGRQIDQPQERLLTGLGVASRLFSPIERSLRSPQPEECRLSTEEAYRFLRDIGPLLESSGFGIVLPAWWHTHRSMRLGLRLRLDPDRHDDGWQNELAGRTPSRQPFNRRVHFSWELTLGGEQLTREAI